MQKAIGWVALVAVAGCSSDYRPVNSPRIAVGIQGGTATYYKDGREYPSGFFGGGTIDVVQGNPRAVAEAEKGHDLVIAGFTVSILGLGGVFTGVVLAADEDNTTAERNAALAFMLGGLATSIVGSILTANAVPHFYDAIAIYNDGVPPPGYGPQFPPPGYDPRQPPPAYNPQVPPPYSPQPPPVYNPQAPPVYNPQAPPPAPAVRPSPPS